MIGDEGRLGEVIEEIADWPLEKRRRLIDQTEQASGKEASDQLKRALSEHWAERKR